MTTSAARDTPALQRTLALLDPASRPAAPDTSRGYLDLLGPDDPTGAHPGQRLMISSALPVIYERLWRPLGGRLALGLMSTGGEREAAMRMLALRPGDNVLDVGCGPGNFTRPFAAAVAGDGLAVGLDASASMLDRAMQEEQLPNLAYVRGDAARLPFADGTFDAVCCFAAIYFIARPHKAIDELVRVLAPGGRVALLSSVSRGLLPAPATDAVVRTLTGVRIFGRDELTGALQRNGLEGIGRHVSGLGQFVGGRLPAA